MKKMLHTTALFLAVLLLFSACGGKKAAADNGIVGKWTAEANSTTLIGYEFTDAGRMHVSTNTEDNLSYVVSDGKIHISIIGEEQAFASYVIKIDGDTMQWSDDEGALVCEFTRPAA